MRKQARRLEEVIRRVTRPLDPTRPHVILRIWAANYFLEHSHHTTLIVEEIIKPSGDHRQYEVENINDEIKFMFQVRWSYRQCEEFKRRLSIHLTEYEATPQYTMNLWAKTENPLTLMLDLDRQLIHYRHISERQEAADGDTTLRIARLRRRSPRRSPKLAGCMEEMFRVFEQHSMGSVPASQFNELRAMYSHLVFIRAKSQLEIDSVRRGGHWMWLPPKQHPDAALQRAHTALINSKIEELTPQPPPKLRLMKRPSVEALREAMIAHRYYMTREQVYSELSVYARKTILKAKQVLNIKTRKTNHWYWVYPAAELRAQLVDMLATGPKPQKDIFSHLGTLPAQALMKTMHGITRKFIGKTAYWVSDIGAPVEEPQVEETTGGETKIEKTPTGVKIEWLQ